MKIAFCVVALFLPLTSISQTVHSKGNGNANVGVNGGTVVVNNNFYAPRKVAKALRIRGEKDQWQGVLYPGKEKTDFGPCKEGITINEHLVFKPGKTDYAIRLGNSAVICSHLPCEIIEINGVSVLSMVKLGHSLGIKSEFRAADSDMVAVLDGNTWHANEREAWYVKRPDIHSIQVFDRKNDETLWVSLKNPHYVAVRGTFRFQDGKVAAQITNSEMVEDTSLASGFCSVNSGPVSLAEAGAGTR